MSKYCLGILVFLLSLSAHAGLKKIAQDFLGNNSQVKVAESQVSLAELDLESLEMTKNTNLTFDSAYSDSQTESFSAFAVLLRGGGFRQPIKNFNNQLALSKDFDWGGNVTVQHTYQRIKVPGTPMIYGYTQGITYTQNLGEDFFGRTFYLQQEELKLNVDFTKADSENTIQNALLSLVRSYYDAALNKSLVKLQNEAKDRASRRLSLIKRRVRDGLREKVDKIQAEISLYQAQEAVKTAQQNFTSAIEALSTAVHRVVPADEIVGLNDKIFVRTATPKGDVKGNQNLQAFEELAKAREKNLERADKSLIPDISLSIGALNNKFDRSTSEAFQESLWGRPNRELTASLNVSWELGSGPEKIEKTRSLVNYQTSKLQLDRLQKDVYQTEKSIRDQINLLSENLKSSSRRLSLARSALKEYNKLYERGRADLDRLIQAEETLINTEINHVNYLSQRERLVHTLAFLYGDLRGFLTE